MQENKKNSKLQSDISKGLDYLNEMVEINNGVAKGTLYLTWNTDSGVKKNSLWTIGIEIINNETEAKKGICSSCKNSKMDKSHYPLIMNGKYLDDNKEEISWYCRPCSETFLNSVSSETYYPACINEKVLNVLKVWVEKYEVEEEDFLSKEDPIKDEEQNNK